jgi:hypothetical protein
VRGWHRERLLQARQNFSCSWERGGEPCGKINVRTECDVAILSYWSQSGGASEWKSIEQRVPITWTACHFGGRRPWFLCSVYSDDRYCGRRAAVLYCAGALFACRRCWGLAYESQQETPMRRGVFQAQKIRMRLGGSVNLFEPFPEKPKRMHWLTYLRLRARAEAAEHYSNELTTQWLNRHKRSR